MRTRIKFRDMPGDVPKSEKIAMLEGRHPNKNGSKNYKKMILSRERAILKERTKRMIRMILD